MFGQQGMWTLTKTLIKFVVFGLVAYLVASGVVTQITGTGRWSLTSIVAVAVAASLALLFGSPIGPDFAGPAIARNAYFINVATRSGIDRQLYRTILCLVDCKFGSFGIFHSYSIDRNCLAVIRI